MRSKAFIYTLTGLLIIATAVFIIFFWNESTKGLLSYQEKRLLAGLDEIVLVGDSGYPPLSFTDKEGQFSGYEAELVIALENWLGKSIVYRQMIWSEALSALTEGEVHGITGMRITPERDNLFNFTRPYWQTAYSLVHEIGQDHEALMSQSTLKAALQESSATYDFFMENLYHSGVTIISVKNPAEAMALLRLDAVDIWFENYQVARYESLKEGYLDLFGFYIVQESIGQYAIAFGANDGALVPIFNKALQGLEKDGALSVLDRKWFGLADNRQPGQQSLVPIFSILYLLFMLLGLTTLWNRLLQIKVDQRTGELSKSESKFKSAFEGSHDAIFVSTIEGRTLDCNWNAVALFGYDDKDDFIKAIPQELSPVEQPDGIESYSRSRIIVKDLVEANEIKKFEWLHLRKDGSTFLAEVSLTTYLLSAEQVIHANIIDITERKAIQARLEFLSLHDQLTGLYNRAFFEEELQRFSGSRSYPITLISCDLDGLKLINDTMGHDKGDLLLKECASLLRESLRSEDVLARIGGDEFSAILPFTDRETAEEIARRIRSNISKYNQGQTELPLGLSIGLATAYSKEISLKDLFKQADDLMYKDKLYRSASMRNKVVESLLAAMAERDFITEGHVQRLEKICLQIGEKVGLSSRQLADLALLAKVHDLGKVGIPDRILNKPGPLDDAEWEIMKQHSDKGFRIASSSPDLAGVADLILKHHEYWDGSGYPLGLEGEDIPIECRIIAIVDAFDAMTHDRPYAAAKSRREAIDEIVRAAGSQFDPALVDAFVCCVPI